MDFLPSKDLEDFIISEVLRKEIDQMMAEGHRFDIATTFVADKQHRTSHSLGTTRRATPATLIVRCRRSDIADWSDLVCDFDSNPTTSLAKRVSWRLTAGGKGLLPDSPSIRVLGCGCWHYLTASAPPPLCGKKRASQTFPSLTPRRESPALTAPDASGSDR